MSFACTLHELLLLAAPAAWPSSATSQDAPRLEQLARAHDAAAIRERASTRPWSTGTELRVLLTLLQQARGRGDDERAAVLREELETLASELGDERWSQALRAVLHWSAAECAAYDRARGELERIESEATRERATAPPIESVLQAALDELSRVPDGARVLFGPVSTRIARVALASDDAARALELGDVGTLAQPAESPRFSDATLIGACAAAAEEFRDGETFVWCLEAVGRAAWSSGDLASARPFYSRAFDLERALGHGSKAVPRACDLSSIELGLGELTAAWNHARSAAELARTLGERGARLASTECLASVELELGQHEQALARLDALAVDLRARDADPSTAADAREVRIELLRGNILADIGELSIARSALERAHDLARRLDPADPELLIEVRLALGLLEGDLGDAPGAVALLEQVQRAAVERGDPRAAAWARKNLGYVNAACGNLPAAAREFAAASEYAREHDEPFLAAFSALGRAEVELRRDDAPLAPSIGALLDEAEQQGRELRSLELRARIGAARAELARRGGDHAAQRRELKDSVAAWESLRARFSRAGLLERLLHGRADPYRELALAAVRDGDLAAAWRASELLRGRVLQELRDASRLDARAAPAISDAVLAARRAVSELEARARAAPARIDPKRGLESTSEPASTSELEAARVALDAALLAESARDTRGAALCGRAQRAFDLEALAGELAQARLDALVEFVVGARSSAALVVGPRGASMHPLDLTAVRLAALVERIRAPIEALDRGEIDLAHLSFDDAAARELYDRLLRPIAAQLGSRVAVVADGELASLPLECLVESGERGARSARRPFAELGALHFAAQDRAFVQFPSARLVARSHGAGTAAGTLVLATSAERGFGSVADELRSLRERRSETQGAWVELRDPSSSELLSALGSARWIHLAAHGEIDREHPASSRLSWTDARGAAACVEAWELARQPLDAELVVLSACRSGEGRYAPGEGLLGLTRSLLAAGAREVVASVWTVEDRAAAELWQSYYTALAAGADSLEALRRARRIVFASDDPRGFSRAHPFFWAGWTSVRAR